ncbi:aminotransferase [Microtetraspora sp. NBRC 13810]|uniref:aspartate aminotransferase family protein n=1 Tax=Microtetraspora sp. NBRC 13810 TaxID=3030990 RepID=UPI0025567786|nr:aspartate aminotransferase family protein [Microtetraspora sp. NBRC 13810]GLW10124.1 aminotransferase [Microtetraspora sp. NBRC 13810]
MAQVTAPDETIELYRRHLSTGRAALSRLLGDIVETASNGVWVTAAGGRRFLDFGGYGVFILGHRHPRVIEAVHRQLDLHPLATRVFAEPVTARAAEALAAVTPPGLDYVHFVNSGTEATETAIKLARAHGRTALVSARSGFHGKTIGALSVTANPLYQQPFAPLLTETTHVGYGDAAELRAALAERPGRACVVLEPVQGEGGVVVPPRGYLRAVADACAEYGALLVVDEIQTGLGRLGSWWGVEDEGVVPDMLLTGKGLSGGVVPVAAMVARADVYEPFGRDPFLHSSTFGGSPLACAAALATIQVLQEEDLVHRAAKIGARLLAEVRRTCERHAPGRVTEVRGRGLLIGLEFATQADVGELVLDLLARGVLVNHSLNASRVLRLTPPAVLEESDLAFFHEAFDSALRAVVSRA